MSIDWLKTYSRTFLREDDEESVNYTPYTRFFLREAGIECQINYIITDVKRDNIFLECYVLIVSNFMNNCLVLLDNIVSAGIGASIIDSFHKIYIKDIRPNLSLFDDLDDLVFLIKRSIRFAYDNETTNNKYSYVSCDIINKILHFVKSLTYDLIGEYGISPYIKIEGKSSWVGRSVILSYEMFGSLMEKLYPNMGSRLKKKLLNLKNLTIKCYEEYKTNLCESIENYMIKDLSNICVTYLQIKDNN